MIATCRMSWRMLVTGRELYVRSRAMSAAAGRILLVSVAVALAMFAAARPVSADEGWVITSFQSQLTVNRDSTMAIIETIRVNSAKEHPAIYRTIPLRYRYDDNTNRH